MGNISKEKLWALFRLYLIRKEEEEHSYTPPSYCGVRCGGIGTKSDYFTYRGTIYFYEWSDMNRAPIMFYSVTAFDDYMKRCNIFMPPFQRDMIRNLDHAYVTCKKGKSELLIRGTRPGLLEALAREDAPGVSVNDLPPLPEKDGQLRLPYPVACTYPPSTNRVPPMYNYHGNPEEWIG
jgi:hypothetical protein